MNTIKICRKKLFSFIIAGGLSFFATLSVYAQAPIHASIDTPIHTQENINRAQKNMKWVSEYFSLSIFVGLGIAGLIVAVVALLLDRSVRKKQKTSQAELMSYKRQNESFSALLALTGQCAVIWGEHGRKPQLVGRLFANSPSNPEEFMQFSEWLTPHSVRILDKILSTLHETGEPAEIHVETISKQFLHVSARIVGVQPVLKFQDISSDLQESVEQKKRADHLMEVVQLAQALLDKLNAPIWFKDEENNIVWVNQAYRLATDSEDKATIPEFLNDTLLSNIHSSGRFYEGVANLNIHGERHKFALTHVALDAGSAGIALDVTREDDLDKELTQVKRGYTDLLDLVPTAVMICDADQNLQFFNQAFAMLWPQERGFLETMPSHSRLLDQLREKGAIAQQPNWTEWKTELFSAYFKSETIQQIWNLPDGKTLRVLGYPLPQGGVTWLFDNLTEKLDLETRFNTLIMMQSETLDQLSEGVVVFGPDGRIRLSNPAFTKLWSLPSNLAVEGTHINDLKKACEKSAVEPCWAEFVQNVTGFSDQREMLEGRVNLHNGTIFDYSCVPLPKGQVMLTFVNVTDSVHYAQSLQDKNEALQTVDKLRNDFIQHVSYELRTPLTNIIGFADLMKTPSFGTLTQRQSEYLDHIGAESDELLNLVNDILDLATADAGIMELNINEIHIADLMHQAVLRVEDRAQKQSIMIAENVAPDMPVFYGDSTRLHKVFFNLLTNAVNFSPENSVIEFSAYAKVIEFSANTEQDEIIFKIQDHGCGIPEEILDSAFKRFSALSHHGARAGAGLGLSIVESVVKLHGGYVTIDTGANIGTTVLCHFPLNSHIEANTNHEMIQ